MSSFGGFGKPGQGAAAFTSEREIVAQGFDANQFLFKSVVISGTTRDAGNTPTTVLRPGLLLGRIDATGEYEQWDADAATGVQNMAGVLWKELRAQDFDATNTDRVFTILVGRGVLRADMLLVQGVALIGHIDEYLARAQLAGANFQLDDDPFNYKGGSGSSRMATVTGTTDTLTAAENGTTLLYNNAASVTVTLPAIAPGLSFNLIRAGDEEFIIVSAEGDNVIVGNDLSADGVTFTTASEHLGATVRVESVYVGTTLKWRIYLPYVPFNTGVNTLTFAINT